MNDEAKNAAEQFTNELIKALDTQSGQIDVKAKDSPKKNMPDPFFTSRMWFFLAVFAVIVNIIMMGVAFRQHMQIDYLVTKIIGE